MELVTHFPSKCFPGAAVRELLMLFPTVEALLEVFLLQLVESGFHTFLMRSLGAIIRGVLEEKVTRSEI
jgi:hypothetical protein